MKIFNNPSYINIGYGNIVMTNRIITIVSPDSAPIKRLITDAKDSKTCVDATYGRRTRSVIITDSGTVVLSPIQPETLLGRASGKAEDKDQINKPKKD